MVRASAEYGALPAGLGPDTDSYAASSPSSGAAIRLPPDGASRSGAVAGAAARVRVELAQRQRRIRSAARLGNARCSAAPRSKRRRA